MLAKEALSELTKALASVSKGFAMQRLSFGDTAAVEQRADEAIALFQYYSKRTASRSYGYACCLALMRGRRLDDYQYHLVAAYLNEPLRERDGETLMGSSKLPEILAVYEAQTRDETLWRLTWFGLLCSYFGYTLEGRSALENENWTKLRTFLSKSWPLISRKSAGSLVPDWMRAIRRDPEVLGEDPARRYAHDYLHGERAAIERMAADLAIPNTSWFWHQLVLSAVQSSADERDEKFKNDIPRLLALLREHPGSRDLALEMILARYHRCAYRELHAQLRDYAVSWNVWRNPKLRAAGQATAWNRVSPEVWQMVLHWVNDSNLRDFFQILVARAGTDEGRLEFWGRYLGQISWTKLCFGPETRTQVRRNKAIAELFARERGGYAQITGAYVPGDAFMMQIGKYIIVEFSETGSPTYVYPQSGLKFDLYAGEYDGGTSDLRFGFYDKKGTAVRIAHHVGWEESAAQQLKDIGIFPD